VERFAEGFKRVMPVPVCLITTVDAGGRVNAAPYSCVTPILRPLDLVAVASAPGRQTLENIRETGHFVINVVGKGIFRQAVLCARNYPKGVNELEEVGLETMPAHRVKPPRVRGALGWIEAVLEEEIKRQRYSLVIGKVVAYGVNEEALREGDLPIVGLVPEFRLLGDRVAGREDFPPEVFDHHPKGAKEGQG